MEYLAKSRFPFCKIVHSLVLLLKHTNEWNMLQKVVFFFAVFFVRFAFTSINNKSYTNKWNILQISRFPFCKIVHLLVLLLKHILINGISCKKVVFFFARLYIY